jgi:hypothetical protein
MRDDFIHKEDLPAFRGLGVVVAHPPNWISVSENLPMQVGEIKSGNIQPWNKILRCAYV